MLRWRHADARHVDTLPLLLTLLFAATMVAFVT